MAPTSLAARSQTRGVYAPSTRNPFAISWTPLPQRSQHARLFSQQLLTAHLQMFTKPQSAGRSGRALANTLEDFCGRPWSRVPDPRQKARPQSQGKAIKPRGFFSVFPDFIFLIALGKAPLTVCNEKKHSVSPKYQARLHPFRFVTKNAKVVARAKLSAPPRPFQTTLSRLKALREGVVTIYSHFQARFLRHGGVKGSLGSGRGASEHLLVYKAFA